MLAFAWLEWIVAFLLWIAACTVGEDRSNVGLCAMCNCAADVLGMQRELCQADAMVACQHALKLYDKELLKEACCMSHVQLNSGIPGILVKVVLTVFERYLSNRFRWILPQGLCCSLHLGRSYQSLKAVEDQTWILPSSFAAGRWPTKLGPYTVAARVQRNSNESYLYP